MFSVNYTEKITKSWKEFIVFDKKKEFMLDVYYDLSVNDLQIYLEVGGHVGSSHRVKRRFNMCRNLYVIQNYKEIFCIWTRLALQYKNFKIYEKNIDKYILYKNRIEKYVQLIEMGSWFRTQCCMHNLPMEVRKKICYAVARVNCGGHFLECEAFAKKILP